MNAMLWELSDPRPPCGRPPRASSEPAAALHWLGKCVGVALAVSVAACGGGSPDAPAAATALTLSGTATRSAAISSKTVEAKCATGVGSGTSGADGTYSFNVDSGQWPCLLRVTDDNGTLHTVAAPAQAGATTATANITPVTQQVVANLAGADPTAYYATFGASAAVSVTPAAVAAAQTTVRAALDAGGVHLTGDLISAPVTPDYMAALTALPGTPLLPGDLLARPAAGNCAALRSGTYRIIFPRANALLADQYGKLVINDVNTLAITFSDGSTGNWTANGQCRYTDDSGRTDIVVSPAGVIVVRYIDDDNVTHRIAIAFPEQTHTLAELAGNRTVLAMERNAANTGYTGVAITGTVDAAGLISAVTHCQDDDTWSVTGAACSSVASVSYSFRANTDGGFDSIDTATGVVQGRGFAYRAGGGELMFVSVFHDGSFNVQTERRSNGLPTVGTMTTRWNLSMGNQLGANTLGVSSDTILAVDAAAGSWLRNQRSVGGTNDSPHPETLFANNPRPGYTFRAPGTGIAEDGSTATFSEFTAIGLSGMGMSALLLPSLKWFMFSVNQP